MPRCRNSSRLVVDSSQWLTMMFTSGLSKSVGTPSQERTLGMPSEAALGWMVGERESLSTVSSWDCLGGVRVAMRSITSTGMGSTTSDRTCVSSRTKGTPRTGTTGSSTRWCARSAGRSSTQERGLVGSVPPGASGCAPTTLAQSECWTIGSVQHAGWPSDRPIIALSIALPHAEAGAAGICSRKLGLR